jgi:hypothetical protein
MQKTFKVRWMIFCNNFLKSEGKSNLDYKQACYMEKDDLEAVANPEKLYKTIINDLKSKY